MPSRYLPTWIVSGVSDVVILLCILENTSSQPVLAPIRKQLAWCELVVRKFWRNQFELLLRQAIISLV
jgi:hypothetical protein